MNIMYINHTSIISGAEVSMLDLIKNLNKKLYQPILVCPEGNTLTTKAKTLGINVENINIPYISFKENIFKKFLFLFLNLITTFKLIKLIKKYHITLIHANSIRAGIIVTLAKSITKTPVIWHIRDFLPKNFTGNLVRLFATIFADKIIAISNAVKDNFSTNKRLSKKTVVIYNGIKCKLQNVNLKDKFGLLEEYPIVGIVGQIIDWKGQKEFIQAAHKILKIFNNARFFIVGEALFRTHISKPYKLKLINLTKQLGIEDKVIFTGFREDIVDIMALFDILVLASWCEPFGRVLLEAMALKKPVVATNAGGVPEIVKDRICGILIPPKDPDAIANAVIELAKDKTKLIKMGDAGKKLVEKKFSLSTHIQMVERLYNIFIS